MRGIVAEKLGVDCKKRRICGGFCGIVESLVDLSLKRERGFYFLRKQKVAKDFRFYGIVESRAESAVDSTELQNRWLLKVGKGEGLYFLRKQKVAKDFTHFV